VDASTWRGHAFAADAGQSQQGKVTKRAQRLRFADVFAGCGGLSLGLLAAGWDGLFAVEQDAFAFKTLKHNLIDKRSSRHYRYAWPGWLPKTPQEITKFNERYARELATLKGQVTLLAGGPPCQGFSQAGRRKRNDPRNGLFKHYVALVRILKPEFLLLENVKGISVAYQKLAKGVRKKVRKTKPFSERIKKTLENEGYAVFTRLIRAMELGVPQFRPRYIMLAIRRDLLQGRDGFDPFQDFESRRSRFLKRKGLPVGKAVTVKQAISDLETRGKSMRACVDSIGFEQIEYGHPRSTFQKLMHGDLNGTAPNSLRLAIHRKETRARFRKILSSCRKGVQLSTKDRDRFGLKKHSTTPLRSDRPSHTLTTLPDDFLHYSEPRILTVREYARLQTFPDWYAFRGKYTTGDDRRLRECPRYTQAANAVPPFLAEFLGLLVKSLNRRLRKPAPSGRGVWRKM